MQNFCKIDPLEIMTLKSGKYVLSANCDFQQVLPKVVEAQVLYMTVNDLPILPELASQMDRDLIRRSIHGTAAIEGNPLDIDEVDELLSGEDEHFDLDVPAREIINLKRAYDDLMGEIKSDWRLTEDFIKLVHKTITYGISHRSNEPGCYRNYKVEVGDSSHGGKYIPPKILPDIQKIMPIFIDWINGGQFDEVHPFIKASIAHYYLGLIHPFGDGNGRTARFIEASILTHKDYKYVPKMLSNYYYKNMDKYYSVFRSSERSKEHNINPFVTFSLDGIIASLNDIRGRITYSIRLLALRDYNELLRSVKKITKRQSDLLKILLEENEPFSKKDLFSKTYFKILYKNVSEDTARRDIKNLVHLGILIKDKDRYRLNINALG